MNLKVACLGAGYFSQFHYDAWSRIEQVQVVGACDDNHEAAAQTGVAAFDGFDQMLRTTKPDLVDIIIPPSGHLAAIRTAIVEGVGHIICQKPFCASLSEAKEATALAHSAGVTLVIHENFRFQPWYRIISQTLQSGRIGQVHQVTFRLRPGDGQGRDAYLDRQPYFQTMPRFLIHETAVHWIDVFRFLLGSPTAVYSDLRRLNPAISGEDAGYVIFDHANGARALFDGNRHLDHVASNTRNTMGEALVEGTNGTLTLTGDGKLTCRAFGEQTAETLLEPRDWNGFGGDCVFALQSHVTDAILNGTEIENLASDYLEVLEIEEAVYRSAAEGRKIAL